MELDFNKLAVEGKLFVKELAKELGYPKDTPRAGRVLQSILHALRNQLTVEESVHLIENLPTFLKAVYVNKWYLNNGHKPIKNVEDFLLEVCYNDRSTFLTDFPKDEDIEMAVSVIFNILKEYISADQLESIRAHFPQEVKPLLTTGLAV